jgi:hypothetical protein
MRPIQLDKTYSQLVHWCDGEQSKIRMQETRGKISGNKIDNSGNRDETEG